MRGVVFTVQKDIIKRDYSKASGVFPGNLDFGDLKSEDKINGVYWK